MPAIISPADEASIAYYFRAQSQFERSTFGSSLERQATIGLNSDGKRIKLADRSWDWMPDRYVRTEDGTLSANPEARPPPMPVSPLHGDGELGYEVDDDVLIRFASASRRMLAVERRSLAAKRALEAYYGDRGSRWAHYSADEYDAKGQAARRGAGPGSIAALYLLTLRGQAFIASERANGAQRAGLPEEAMPHLTDDDVLANAFALQQAQPDGARAARLSRVRDEAEALLVAAWRVWAEAVAAESRPAVPA